MRSPLTLFITVLFLACPPFAAAAAPRSASCLQTEGRDVGRCATDTIKQWQREHYDDHEKERQDHTSWHRVNDLKGVTPENLKAHRDFHEHAKRVHSVFHANQRQKEQQFDTELTRKREGVRVRPTTARPLVSPDRFAEGLTACAKFKSEEEHRACMRPYLRPPDRYGRTGR